MKIVLATPRGFCAGVDRAIAIVEKAIQKFGPPIYVRHEIVHNKYVVEDLKKKGAIFVNEIEDVPDGGLAIFSAHGVSLAVEESARIRELAVIDATCPLVSKVHLEAQKNERSGKQIILIGHRGHPEVEGTSGRIKEEMLIISSIEEVVRLKVKDPNKLAYITQTTLSVDETRRIIAKLKEVFPNITGPELKDICYATQNRQNAVRELAKISDIILVVGSLNSSNSNRLKDLAEEAGCKSYLIDEVKNIKPEWINKVKLIGITAGASAPEILVQEIVDYFVKKLNAEVSILPGKQENVIFKLPKELINV